MDEENIFLSGIELLVKGSYSSVSGAICANGAMDPFNGTNGCFNGANGDEVSGANGGPNHYWRQ